MDPYDIWAVLEHYGWELPAPRGNWQTVRCFAHDDSHQSCRISHDVGRVKCMACGFAGDAIDVVKHYEGTEFRDSKRRVEEITGGSRTGVPRSGGRGRSVSGGQRGNERNRRYVPPRLRGRTDGGA